MRITPLLLCAPLLVACSSTSFTATNTAPKPLAARPRDAVVMYTVGLPERPYAEIGIVEASGINWTQNTPSPLIALRAVAAARGCEGVIVMGPHDRLELRSAEQASSSGEGRVASSARIVRGASLGYHHGFRSTYRGTCIAYL